MERLRKVVAPHGRWSALTTYIDRIEAHASSHFSHAIENAKALLETIGKEICQANGIKVGATASINSVLKKAFTAMGYRSSSLVTQISSALATIGQHMGDLRSHIGPTAHGKPLEELEERNNKVDALTREFLIDTTIIVAAFLIRSFENENPQSKPEIPVGEFLHSDHDQFNDYWDDIYGDFQMGNYSYPASEILFHVDKEAYQSEFRDFKEDN